MWKLKTLAMFPRSLNLRTNMKYINIRQVGKTFITKGFLLKLCIGCTPIYRNFSSRRCDEWCDKGMLSWRCKLILNKHYVAPTKRCIMNNQSKIEMNSNEAIDYPSFLWNSLYGSCIFLLKLALITHDAPFCRKGSLKVYIRY